MGKSEILDPLDYGKSLFQLQLWKMQKIDVFLNFAKFTGKHMYWSLFFGKDSGFQAATLLKKRLSCRRFPPNFAKSFRTPFLRHTSRQLLLSAARILLKPTKKPTRCPMKCMIFHSLIYHMKVLENLPKSLKETCEGVSFR